MSTKYESTVNSVNIYMLMSVFLIQIFFGEDQFLRKIHFDVVSILVLMDVPLELNPLPCIYVIGNMVGNERREY